jgi:Ca2+/Na+ antiporter
MRPVYVSSILFLCVILLSWAFGQSGDRTLLYIGGVLYTVAYYAVVIFLLTLAWRATKALEKAAEEQKNTAYFLRELVMQKSKEEKQS